VSARPQPRLREVVGTPSGLAWFLEVGALIAALPLLLRRVPLPRLLEMLTPARSAWSPGPECTIRAVDWWLGRRIGMFRPNCLTRALVLYRFLVMAGLPVEFRLGARMVARPETGGLDERLLGHAWLVVGDAPFAEERARVDEIFRETYRFPAAGSRPVLPGSRLTSGSSTGSADAPSDELPAGHLGLLAACARTRISPDCALRARCLATDIGDWPGLVRLARLHGVLPLVHERLREICPDLVPPPVLDELRRHHRQLAARNAFLLRRLGDTTALLDRHGICAMPFKGPTLALASQGRVDLRQFNDLDLLIRADDVPRLESLLGAAGYRHDRTGPVWCYTRFRDPASGVALDFQWSLAPSWYRFPLDLDAVWRDCGSIDSGGRRLLQPSPEHLLLLLCGHGVKHCWSKLGWIVDVGELVRRQGRLVDWEGLAAEASRVGGLRGLLLGLSLARDLNGIAFPAPLEPLALGDRALLRLSARVTGKLAAPEADMAGHNGAFGPRDSREFHLAARERWRDRGPYLAEGLRQRARPRRAVRRAVGWIARHGRAARSQGTAKRGHEPGGRCP
jgi:hypothetical protein